ncbi:MAG TPA: DUF2330 domain-containing protein, partial [Actinomycetota bacterium]|nr:DUF2330 domain-containing protein [Actinomycetota bacterium]
VVRTTTLSAYVDGVEHYVTRFEFQGAEGKGSFGSIVPLPDVPTEVQKGGDWTLERLVLETQPVALPEAAGLSLTAARTADVEVLLEKRISGLDITILRGGGFAVGRWAERNGFGLTPDAPEILDFYANRSPVFMAAKFDVEAAARRGIGAGDGVAIHLTIPTDDPWVPLRILTLGQDGRSTIDADVYLLTEREPALLPGPAGTFAAEVRDGLRLKRSEAASPLLLKDMRSDRGMGWLPKDDMWLTYLRVNEPASELTYDLAIDVSGRGQPSPVDAGIVSTPVPDPGAPAVVWVALALLAGTAVIAAAAERRSTLPA